MYSLRQKPLSLSVDSKIRDGQYFSFFDFLPFLLNNIVIIAFVTRIKINKYCINCTNEKSKETLQRYDVTIKFKKKKIYEKQEATSRAK